MGNFATIRIRSDRAQIAYQVDEDRRLRLVAIGQQDEESEKLPLAYPASGDGWVFEPAIAVTHSDGNTSTDLRVVDSTTDGDTTRISLRDPIYPFRADLFVRVRPEDDVFETWVTVSHEEPGAVAIECIASSAFDFGDADWHLTQFHGEFTDEANMAEERLGYGLKLLDSKLGVRAHQFRAPWFLLSRGPAEENEGEVFAGSLAWSGSFRFTFEKLPSGRLMVTAGINPFGSRYFLEPGDRFETPRMAWGWSGRGTGELTRKLHRYVRREVIRDGDRPRAVLLNNWEATYFQFDEEKITSLFAGASDLGMELFLLDDGWFGEKHARDNDTRGLGDWTTDPKKLPNGLKALTDAAERNGLRFGLWFEPEMVNPCSELFENHPDWVIQQPGRKHELQRHQMVLDLANPEVEEFSFEVLHRTLSANPGITYVKWDCNRYLTQPGSPYLPADRQSHLQVEYVRALYRIMSRLQEAHPDVEVMMCSGGGGRVDYGALRFAHEVWPSDMTDPLRRIFIQWGFSHFVPAVAMANHVTRWGNRPIKFCFDVAMSGRLGMDVDLAKLNDEDRSFAASAIEAYKGIREVVQFGDLYRLESPYDGPRTSLLIVYGDRAVLFIYASEDVPSGRVRLEGIDANRTYSIREINAPIGQAPYGGVVSGETMLRIGFELSALSPVTSAVYELTAY